MSFAPGSKKTQYLQCFLDSTEQNTGICEVFGMLQEVIFPCRSHKTHVNYTFLGLILRFCDRVGWGEGPEMNSNRLNNQVTGLDSPFTSYS